MNFRGDTTQPITPCEDTGVEPARLIGIQEPQQGRRRILKEKDGEIPDVTSK